MRSSEHHEDELSWIVESIRECGFESRKVIVYVTSIDTCDKLYCWLHLTLGSQVYGGEKTLENRIVEMYHSGTDADSQQRIAASFCQIGGNIRVLIATTAFGMGMQIPDVSVVVLWGLPHSTLQFWQELGRCARDGREGICICYAFPRSITQCSVCLAKQTYKCSCEVREILRKLTDETVQECQQVDCKSYHTFNCKEWTLQL